MGSTGGSLAVLLAILLVSSRADSNQESKSSDAADQDGMGSKASTSKDTLFWALSRSGLGDGLRSMNIKRNFDEIDHTIMPFPNAYKRYSSSGMTMPIFHKYDDVDRSMAYQNAKRNFDEIDHTTMPFPFAFKRYFSTKVRMPPNYVSRQGMKRNFDEIDYTAMPFPNSYKRYYTNTKMPNYASRQNSKRNFDEIDFTSMPFPNSYKRYHSSNSPYYYFGNNGDWMTS